MNLCAERVAALNMYINERNTLCFIKNEEAEAARKRLADVDNIAPKHSLNSNRRAGWHSGGAKKPQGFYTKYC